MNYWHLTENPTGSTYHQMMEVLCHVADSFYVVTRQELDYDVEVLKQFMPYIVRQYETNEWAGTVTQGPPATICVIEANVDTCHLLQQLADSLFEWVAPKLPEDLTFLKDDRVIFSSTTHEKMGCFELLDAEEFLLHQIEGLTLEKSE